MKAVWALFFFTIASAIAQHEVNWSSIDAGGARSTGGVYVVTSTIGQPDAAVSTGGRYSLHGGFWSAFVVQADDGPSLRIFLSGRNATLAWPNPSTGFQLQESASLTPPNWTDINTPPSIVGSEKQVSVALQPGNRYFRLQRH
jgi:hypothetical protein